MDKTGGPSGMETRWPGKVARADADKRTGRPIRLNNSKWSVGLLCGSRSMNRYGDGAEKTGECRQEIADLIRFQTGEYKIEYKRLYTIDRTASGGWECWLHRSRAK